MFTSKCAWRHSCVPFFEIRTSKSGPNLVFSCTFWLENALGATAVHILTSKCASRHSGVQFFHIPTSKSDPNMVCFLHFDFKMCFAPQQHANFSFLLWPTWLRTRRFSEPSFRPSQPTNHWKNTVFRDLPNISRSCIFFLLVLSLSLFLLSSTPLFPLTLLCFSFLHIVGSLTSKLPLITHSFVRTLDILNFRYYL